MRSTRSTRHWSAARRVRTSGDRRRRRSRLVGSIRRNPSARRGEASHVDAARGRESTMESTLIRCGPGSNPLRRTVSRVLASGLLSVCVLSAGTLLLVSGAPIAAAATVSPLCTAGTCTVTSPETGTPVSWSSPLRVGSVSVTLYGADGASDGGSDGTNVPGGSGAEVRGTVVAPGATAFTLDVGGAGTIDGQGGYNGGGQAGADGAFGGGGGGATALLEASTPLLVAGGGGGGGTTAISEGTDGAGGSGGNADAAGRPGQSVTADGANIDGGGGGGAGTQGGVGGGGDAGAASGTSTCTHGGTEAGE